MGQNEGGMCRWISQSLSTTYAVDPEQTRGLDCLSTFSRCADAAVHPLYGQERPMPVDLLAARTLPLDEGAWNKAHRHLRKYFRRHGGESRNRIRHYGEIVCCLRAPDLPTDELFQQRLTGIPAPGTYSARQDPDAPQILPVLLRMRHLYQKDATNGNRIG